ncbi:MAG: hypothetical protein ACTSXX_10110 [Candidatus Baldrarchaeia archaeon]
MGRRKGFALLVHGAVEDFRELLLWLEGRERVSYWEVMESLYRERERFRLYFKKILLFGNRVVDSVLDNDIMLLERLGVLRANGEVYDVDHERLRKLLELLES